MKKKIPLSYRIIRQIKAEEYARFYSRLPEYGLYMNHLGEVRWMTEAEADKQHEFFIYNEGVLKRIQIRWRVNRTINLKKLSQAEKEIRLRIRQHLEQKHRDKVKPDSGNIYPDEWQYEMSDEELDRIAISMDIGGASLWRNLAIIFGLFIIIGAVWYFWSDKIEESHTGRLLVQSGDISGRVFLNDKEFLGYTNTELSNVPEGEQRIFLKKDGYETVPAFRDVRIVADSLVKIEFVLKRSASAGSGFIRLNAPFNDSKVFINNRYHGRLSENKLLALIPGEYSISVEKDGYFSVPAQKIINVISGDTVLFSVEQILAQSARSSTRLVNPENIGSLEISSNIKGAKIILDGRDTGQETDHVFTQMPLGNYRARVQFEGYDVQPEEVLLNLTQKNPAGNAEFKLTRMFEKITVRTQPPNGTIYIDDEFKGEGSFEGVLKVGTHTISFGDISGYKKPKSRTITLKARNPFLWEVNYFPKLTIYAGINSTGSLISDGCDISTGYTFKNQSFTASTEGGPAIEYNDKIKDYAWKMGYAFPYRNPKGNDAIKITFTMPRDLDYDQNFTLSLIAASSQEKYPLSISTKVDIAIKLNNSILSYYYQPKFLEDLGSLDNVEWDITKYIRPGPNTLEIATTEDNNAFYFLKRVEIFN
jgi:hypothetical protein